MRHFPNGHISPEMHLLDKHTVEWVRRYNFGFGMLGEQRAESIHPPFQRTEHHLQFNQKQRKEATVHPQQKVLAQDSWSRWPGSCPRSQDTYEVLFDDIPAKSSCARQLAQDLPKILPKRPRSCPRGQILPRILPKNLGKILGKILVAIILASWTRSWARGGKSWASCLAQELFAGDHQRALHKYCS